MKRLLLSLVIFLLLSTPAFALFAPEPDEPRQLEEVPLGVGVMTVAGVAGLLVFVKKEKRFMRRHVFRFEKIRKKLREEEYED